METKRKTLFGSQANPRHTRMRVGVGVLVIDSTGRLLLEKRSDCGQWGLAGGRIEPGETVTQAACREVKEETGLDIEVTALVGVYSDPAGRIVTYPGDDYSVHLVDVILAARIVGGSLQCSAESLELRFFAPQELPADIVPPAVAPVQDFIRGRSAVIS